jgi:hypothetical protein
MHNKKPDFNVWFFVDCLKQIQFIEHYEVRGVHHGLFFLAP